ncbi:hypothetical protein GWI33_021231 [Rhynchophorus ferrugineus]|uniref:Uncharacterized protein n=1 Tax=Rhynchophorus ferrugineus TaxID=354439 RepID=A0A834HN25_RHYFE|nr:hypothetical protein GWI33_021231 [Rhynchophorus ferrugineus]
MSRVFCGFFMYLFILDEISRIRCDGNNKTTYVPPGNTKYPHGDEHLINTDIACPDINRAICSESQPPIPPQGKCPFPPEYPGDMKFTNPYVPCVNFPDLYVLEKGTASSEILLPRIQCKSCDVKQTTDASAVVLYCMECYDLRTPGFEANLTARDILYKVTFMEITNYTSVQVTGRENL